MLPVKRIIFLKSFGYEFKVYTKGPDLHKGTGYEQLYGSLSYPLPKLHRILEWNFQTTSYGITLTTCISPSPNSF